MERKARANASKPFFIGMITRDISLSDCILDLLDNSVDAIEGYLKRQGLAVPTQQKYQGFVIDINFSKDHFEIVDRSGGMRLHDAEEYAFRFGRDDDLPESEDHSIGHYGIGMKRAIFKMGNKIWIQSSTGEESFILDLDVNAWRKLKEPDWSFQLTDVVEHGTTLPQGTTFKITELYTSISRQFESPQFEAAFRRILERDYAFILDHGLVVNVNKVPVKGKIPKFRKSEDLQPFRDELTHNDIKITVTVGMGEIPTDDSSAEGKYPDIDRYGWYVVCNERVVLAGDKTSVTGWGVRPVSSWHPQYYGFVGIVSFDGPPGDLPWMTTKRSVDQSHPAYLKALNVMKSVTKQFTTYTNARKKNIKEAKKIERKAEEIAIQELQINKQLVLPQVGDLDMVKIEFEKPRSEVDALAKAFDLYNDSPSEVGRSAFEYAYSREVTN